MEAVIADTTDNILGMDFMSKYRLELRWGPFGDLYLYDKKSDISTLCQFVKVPKNTLPSISSIKVVSPTRASAAITVSDPSLPFQAFTVAALNELGEQSLPSSIPLAYQKLIREFPELMTPNFKDVKHSIVHSIPTGDAAPVRTKARPLLPGSPKAKNGWKTDDTVLYKP